MEKEAVNGVKSPINPQAITNGISGTTIKFNKMDITDTS
jgi:hypothetical protein